MILMYHNVWPGKSPGGHRFQGVTILDHQFERQLVWLRKYFDFVSLSEYLSLTVTERKKRNSAVITFDDGTEVTYDVVVPIVRKYEVPITIFVSTCQLNSGPLIWGAYLNALCFENCYKLIEKDGLKLSLRTTPERKAARLVADKLALQSGDPRQFSHDLGEAYPIPPDIFKFYRGMNSRQLAATCGDSLVEIGGHSVNHYSLSSLADDHVKAELSECKSTLSRLTGCEIDYFAYPNGDYDRRTIRYLKECGYRAGLAVNPKGLQDQTIYELPRTGVYASWKLVIKIALSRLGVAYQVHEI